MSTPTAPLVAVVARTVRWAHRALGGPAATQQLDDVRQLPPGPALPPVRLAAEQVTERLNRLQEEYVYAVNSALEEGREDVAASIADQYDDEALALLSAGPGTRGSC